MFDLAEKAKNILADAIESSEVECIFGNWEDDLSCHKRGIPCRECLNKDIFNELNEIVEETVNKIIKALDETCPPSIIKKALGSYERMNEYCTSDSCVNCWTSWFKEILEGVVHNCES